MQGWEIALLPIAAVIIAGYGLIRRRREQYPAGRHEGMLICEVAFLDRKTSLCYIETCFEDMQIEVLKVERQIEPGETQDLFKNVYTLRLPETVYPGELVNRLSACRAVQSVHTRPV